MGSQNRFLDDLAKLASSLCGLGLGIKQEIKKHLRHKAESIAKDLNLVTREEFEVVRDMAQKARQNKEQAKVKHPDDH